MMGHRLVLAGSLLTPQRFACVENKTFLAFSGAILLLMHGAIVIAGSGRLVRAISQGVEIGRTTSGFVYNLVQILLK